MAQKDKNIGCVYLALHIILQMIRNVDDVQNYKLINLSFLQKLRQIATITRSSHEQFYYS